jgi:hypothetical protein
MAKQLTEQELRQQAVRALSDSLGPVDALRFLALVSREPFDYQQWRKEYFRTTVWMSYSKKFETTTARSIPKHLFDHYFLLSSALRFVI